MRKLLIFLFALCSLAGYAQCDSVTNLTVTSILCNSARVDWVASDASTFFRVYYNASFQNVNDPGPPYPHATGTTISPLTPSTTYYVTVLRQCASGSSTTDTIEFTTPACPCAAVGGVSVTTTASTAGITATEYPAGTSYTLYYVRSGETDTTAVVGPDADFDLTGLFNNTTYYYRIETTCPSGTATTAPNTFSTSQTINYVRMDDFGYQYKRTANDSTLSIPTGSGAPSLRNGKNDKAAVFFDSSAAVFYMFNPRTQTWSAFTAEGQDKLLSGGLVIHLQDYDYRVTAAVYRINNIIYTSPTTDITLSPADDDDPRIDIFYLATDNAAHVAEGEPNFPALEPNINSVTQLRISSANVLPATTEPAIPTLLIYDETGTEVGGEWNATDNTGLIIINSAADACSGTVSINGTNTLATNTLNFGTTTNPSFAPYTMVNFRIKPKATWPAGEGFQLSFLISGVQAGNSVNFLDGQHNFISSTNACQDIAIPLSLFGNITGANTLRFYRIGDTSATIGFYLDYVRLTYQEISVPSPISIVGIAPISVTETANIFVLEHDLSGVDSGTYTNPTVTVNWHGHITNIADGLPPDSVGSDCAAVDSIWREPGIDSIYYSINGVQHAILDSTGGGGASSRWGLEDNLLTGSRIVDYAHENFLHYNANVEYMTQMDSDPDFYSGISINKNSGISIGAGNTVTGEGVSLKTDAATPAFLGITASSDVTNSSFEWYIQPHLWQVISSFAWYSGSPMPDTVSNNYNSDYNGFVIGSSRTDGIGGNYGKIFHINPDFALLTNLDSTVDQEYVVTQIGDTLYKTPMSEFTGGGGVSSVSGTANRITSTGGATPVIDISASYVGQSSITTLGTIGTGVWQGTAIGDTYISSASTWNAKQAGDADLTAIAGLTPTNDDVLQYKAGAWANRTLAQLKADLALNNVDNTSDATKNSATVTLTNKTIAAGSNTVTGLTNTNLSGTAGITAANLSYTSQSLLVNNTGSTAAPSAVTFKYAAPAAYAGTATWDGTPPTTPTITYEWTQIHYEVTLKIRGTYTGAGTTNTLLTLTLPADCPAPEEPSARSAASARLYAGAGGFATSTTGAYANNSKVFMAANAADNGYVIAVVGASGSANSFELIITYKAQ